LNLTYLQKEQYDLQIFLLLLLQTILFLFLINHKDYMLPMESILVNLQAVRVFLLHMAIAEAMADI
jgi:hypothetical protein